jgi:hypothetical protein
MNTKYGPKIVLQPDMRSLDHSLVAEGPPTHRTSESLATPSRLLTLPQELRDLIYKYALTEPEGLSTTTDSSPSSNIRLCQLESTLRYPSQESNQLRYVCRQLHFETNALGLMYNTIQFVDNNHGSAYSLFARFRTLGSLETLRRLKRVVIFDALTPTNLTQVKKLMERSFLGPSGIVEFSRAYPNTVVLVRFNWAQDPMFGSYLQFSNDYFEAVMSTHRWPGAEFSETNSSFMQAMFDHSSFDCPANLKFTPSHGFHEQQVHNGLLWIQNFHPTLKLDQTLDDEKRQHMVAVARKMHEEGI